MLATTQLADILPSTLAPTALPSRYELQFVGQELGY